MTSHCFSVDVEGFCESTATSYAVPAKMIRDTREKVEIERNVESILELLDECGVRGTFFTLGIIAKEQPQLVRKIVAAGHELGSHSYHHFRLYALSRENANREIFDSKKVLEDATGSQVHGFRAPQFSIKSETPYIFDAILEAGYTYDSSVFPIRGHSVYGFPESPRSIHKLSNGLLEFPMATISIFGRILPILGGAYIRFLPFPLTRWSLLSLTNKNESAMSYIHPYEMGSEFPYLSELPLLVRLKRYYNINKPAHYYRKLMSEFSFKPAIDILNEHHR